MHSWGDDAACPDRAAKAFEMIGSGDKEIAWFDRSNHHILWDYDGEEAANRIENFLTEETGSP